MIRDAVRFDPPTPLWREQQRADAAGPDQGRAGEVVDEGREDALEAAARVELGARLAAKWRATRGGDRR